MGLSTQVVVVVGLALAVAVESVAVAEARTTLEATQLREPQTLGVEAEASAALEATLVKTVAQE
jgi:hypothetical protein